MKLKDNCTIIAKSAYFLTNNVVGLFPLVNLGDSGSRISIRIMRIFKKFLLILPLKYM